MEIIHKILSSKLLLGVELNICAIADSFQYDASGEIHVHFSRLLHDPTSGAVLSESNTRNSYWCNIINPSIVDELTPILFDEGIVSCTQYVFDRFESVIRQHFVGGSSANTEEI